jgi:hypothetical protein
MCLFMWFVRNSDFTLTNYHSKHKLRSFIRQGKFEPLDCGVLQVQFKNDRVFLRIKLRETFFNSVYKNNIYHLNM